MEKINIAELLKDCPQGMELDCILFKDTPTYFHKVTTDTSYPIEIKVEHPSKELETFFLNKYGAIYDRTTANCVIFPKGKTTWEGFQRPFKDGDIVTYDGDTERLQIFIFKDKKENDTLSTCYLMLDGDELDLEESAWYVTRLATEEEKQKLFDTIKANGYHWNAETKTLEKLVEPKFKVGDRVRNKNYKDYIYTIHDIVDKGYSAKEIDADYPILILFGSQEDNYELVPNKFDITTLKPFDKVLVRDTCTQNWRASLFSHCNGLDSYKYKCINGCYTYCIPYEGNEHLLGKTDDCDKYYKN